MARFFRLIRDEWKIHLPRLTWWFLVALGLTRVWTPLTALISWGLDDPSAAFSYLMQVDAANYFTVLSYGVGMLAVYELATTFHKQIKPTMLFGNETSQLKLSGLKQRIPLKIKNEGALSILQNSMNFQILVPKEVTVNVFPFEEAPVDSEGNVPCPRIDEPTETRPDHRAVGGSPYIKIFPKRLKKVTALELQFPRAGTYEFLYYFTTDYGFFPRGMKIDKKTNEPTADLAKFTFIVER